jgi:hypothetical protein
MKCTICGGEIKEEEETLSANITHSCEAQRS